MIRNIQSFIAATTCCWWWTSHLDLRLLHCSPLALSSLFLLACFSRLLFFSLVPRSMLPSLWFLPIIIAPAASPSHSSRPLFPRSFSFISFLYIEGVRLRCHGSRQELLAHGLPPGASDGRGQESHERHRLLRQPARLDSERNGASSIMLCTGSLIFNFCLCRA